MSFLFSRSKKIPPKKQHFHRYHSDWLTALSSTHLPLLRCAMSASSPSSLLPTAVDSLLLHLTSYYDSLDSSSSPHLLFPHQFRSSLETPFLYLGDLHPYLFTNLLRSFIEDDNHQEMPGFEIGERSDLFERNWNVIMAWKDPNEALMARIDQIECGVRLMVPALAARAREVQARFVERVGTKWGKKAEGRREKTEGKREKVWEAMEAEMEEMTGVFVDANRLRRSVISDIMSAVDVYQGALFLEGLAEFLVGFRDADLIAEFERCKVPVN